MTRVVAVRHGETDWNREGRMQGWAPVPVNETGRGQATAVGRWLSDRYEFDRAFASDLARRRETAELVADAIGDLDVTLESAWRERDLGIYQGLSHERIESEHPRFGLTETAYRSTEIVPEGGESFRAVEERVVGRFETVAGSDRETVLVITHGGPLRILLGHAKGLELSTALLEHGPENCSVTEFRIDESIEVVRENIAIPTQ